MKSRYWLALALSVVSVTLHHAAAAAVVLETQNLRLVIGENGVVKSLTSRPEGVELLTGPAPMAMAVRGGRPVFPSKDKYFYTRRPVWRGGQWFAASRARLVGEKLMVEFGQADFTAVYHVITKPEYLAFQLEAYEGDAVDRLDHLRLPLKRLPYLGQWINVAYDRDFGVCLCGGNGKTDAAMHCAEDRVELRATAERRVGLSGTTAVLFGCRDPMNRFLDVMEIVERDFGMPAGARRRRSPEQKYSYLWASRPTPGNIDEYITWAKRGGFRMILFSYRAFARGAGHFAWNDSYPNGVSDLAKVTNAVRRAGLAVGLHVHYSKTHRSDAYVTPVPDDRLHKVRTFTLAATVTERDTAIPVKENPAGCTLDEGRRILQIGKELISYDGYATEPPYRFTDCQRGHLETTAAHHTESGRVGLLNVDSWNVFIRFDQNTDVQDEVGRRLAEIVRQTGPYQMIYFDGAEDVHDPYWRHVSNAQHRVYRHFDPEPPVCEAAHYTHFSWHMITRSNAYDAIPPAGGMKAFCDLMPCPTAAARARDFSRIDFGWLGNFGKSRRGGAGPDVWEYVVSRAAAWDCPISLWALTPEDMELNPRAEDCLDVIKTWEDARLEGKLTDAQRERLKNIAIEDGWYVPCFDQRQIWSDYSERRKITASHQAILDRRREHHLFVNERGRYELVEYHEIPGVADGACKAYSFQRDSRESDAYVLIWAVGEDVVLRLPVRPGRLKAMRPFDARLPVRADRDRSVMSIGGRTYVALADMNEQQARRVVREAERLP